MEKDSDLWQTPKNLFDDLNYEFNFDYDVCANAENKLSTFKGDYFNNDFENCVCFMNPPYSSPNKFVEKALSLAKKNVTTVCLLKCDTSTILFHKLNNSGKNVEIRFIKGRIKFIHPKKKSRYKANFSNMIVVIKGYS
jgi:site-specific DNA-methyltransferase (adenine-specific)